MYNVGGCTTINLNLILLNLVVILNDDELYMFFSYVLKL